MWAYLNWALALRRAGCEVQWLESAREISDPAHPGLRDAIAALAAVLAPYGFDDRLIVDTAGPLPEDCGARPLEAAADVDLLVDMAYLGPELVRGFRRAALIDIDPGLTQAWWADGDLDLGGYDAYFTIGDGVASGRAAVPDCGVRWRYLPPCVDLDAWPACPPPPAGAAWTTVTHWWGEDFENSKRAGFEPLLGLPERVDATLELALGGLDDDEERERVERRGWRVADTAEVASTPEQHRTYIQRSRGEFSAAKPLYAEWATGWLSDRTVCYLASGRPAVVQDTGAARTGDHMGLVTFTGVADAAAAIERVEREYEFHCQAARQLAEERYAGSVVAAQLLAQALA